MQLTETKCPAGQEKLRDSLVALYGRLAEIENGRRPLGGFITTGVLDEKYQKVEHYPRLTLRFSSQDRSKLAAYATMSPQELLSCAKSPLERLIVATLWKQADLGKVRHIAAGLVETSPAQDSDPDAPVFRQFGRHLSDPDTQPLADQHTLRAYRYLRKQDLTDKLHRKETVTAAEVREYVLWVNGLADRDGADGRADRLYEFDRSMFALGKATKAFIAACFPKPRWLESHQSGRIPLS